MYKPVAGDPSVSPREWSAAFALSLLVAMAVYGPHVVHGGWYLDDWQFIALLSDKDGFGDALAYMLNSTHRPGLAVVLSIQYAIGGTDQAIYLATGVMISAIHGALLYLVLRSLRLQPAVAGAMAVLFLVLPVVDATRLWVTVFHIQVASMFYLGGLLCAIHGLRQLPFARRGLWHLVAVLMYCAAILTYEATAGLVLVAPAIYVTQTDTLSTLRRLLPDYTGVALTVALMAPRAMAERGGDASLQHMVERARGMLAPAWEVFQLVWVPALTVGGALALVAVGVGVTFALAGRSSPLVDWLRIAVVAAVVAAAGLVMYLPGDAYFVPRPTGLGNRTSALAALGAVPLLVAMTMLGCGGLGALVRRVRLGVCAGGVVVLVTVAVFVVREREQQHAWAQSWTEQQMVLDRIGDVMGPEVPPGTALVTFRHSTFILPDDVSVFAYNWDLKGALWEVYDEFAINGRPWTEGAVCGQEGVLWSDSGGNVGAFAYGGRLIFVDVEDRRRKKIDSRAKCVKLVRQWVAT